MGNNVEICFRNFLRLVLLIAFFVAIGTAIYKWWEEEAYLSIDFDSKEISIPSLTLCPAVVDSLSYQNFGLEQNKTLVQFHEQIEPITNRVIKAEFIEGDDVDYA